MRNILLSWKRHQMACPEITMFSTVIAQFDFYLFVYMPTRFKPAEYV